MGFLLPLAGAAASGLTSAISATAGGAAAAASGAGAAGLASTALSAGTAIVGGAAQAAQAKGQARLMDAEAAAQRRAAAVDAAKERRRNRLLASKDRASAIEGGVFSGTTLGLLADNAAAREMDVLTGERNARVAASGLEAQAAMTRSQAPGYMLGGVLSGVSGGVRDYYGRMRDPLNIGQD